MSDHTAAEKWLRNAPAGVRSVTLGWEYRLSETGQLYRETVNGTYRVSLRRLPPGTYTLNYREGQELDAEETWDYLAGGEERRCVDNMGDIIRVPKGADFGECFDLRHAAEGWTELVRSGSCGLRCAPYTIAPDEPAARQAATEAALANLPPNPQRDSWVRGEMAIGLDTQEAEARDRIREAGETFERRVEAHGMGKLQALGALADALPVDVEAERAISKLAAAKRADREVRPIERSCCREARERVKRQRRELRRLNRCLAEARAPEDYAGACEERDAAIAERDEAKHSLTLWQNAYRTHFAPQHDETKHPNEWPEVMRVTVERLRAEHAEEKAEHRGTLTLNADLRAQCDTLKHAIANWKTEEQRWNEEMTELRAEVERLTDELGEWTSRFGPSAEDVADDWAQYQATAITLPTDTTTPLDPAQRAVALMGERLVALDGRTIRQNGDWYDILLEHGWVALGEEDTILRDLIDPTVTVTLAPEPEPEPERRKLTFGEACAAGGKWYATVADVDYEIRDGFVYFLMYFRGCSETHARITPAMLAAEWEAS